MEATVPKKKTTVSYDVANAQCDAFVSYAKLKNGSSLICLEKE